VIVEKREQLAKSPVSSAIVSGAITRPVTALASVAASAGVSAGPSDRRQRDAEGPSARRQHDEGIRGDSGPSKRRQYDEAGPGGRREGKQAKTEVERLAFSAPGLRNAPTNSPGKRTRSGRCLPAIAVAELELEDALREWEGSREDRALHLAAELKHHLKGFIDDHDGGGGENDEDISAPLKLIGAIESFEQQMEDEKSSVRRSIAFLGRNGCGKSFLINLALQVRSKWVYLLKRDPLPDSHRCFDPPSSNDQPDKKHDKQFSR